MITVRTALPGDKEAFKSLWKICFGDSGSFIEWFFDHRFLPPYSVVLEEDGNIVSCMQSYPYHVRIRNQVVEGAMLAGVCTHPDHRHKGHMRKIFTFTMRLLRQKGMMVAVHTPAVLNSYFGYGHFPVSDAWMVSASEIPPLAPVEGVYQIPVKPAAFADLFACYQQVSKTYSGIISRTFSDFVTKANDYGCDGGKCLAYAPEGKLAGYCFYYATDKEVVVPEIVAENIGDYEKLLTGLCVYHPKLALSAKLPPEIRALPSFCVGKQIQKGVMGAVDLPGLLGIVCGKKGYAMGITDLVVAGNQGVFDLDGQPVAIAPHVEMDAGSLMQLLVGYRTLYELRDAGKATIHDAQKAEEINQLLQPQPCYIIDEY